MKIIPIGTLCLNCQEPITAEHSDESVEWGGEYFHGEDCAWEYGENCGRPIHPEMLDRAAVPECRGHEPGPHQPMGTAVYCDGTCRAALARARGEGKS